MISLILMLFGFVLFVLAGLNIPPQPAPPNPSRPNFIAWGLACWILAEVLKVAPPLFHS